MNNQLLEHYAHVIAYNIANRNFGTAEALINQLDGTDVMRVTHKISLQYPALLNFEDFENFLSSRSKT